MAVYTHITEAEVWDFLSHYDVGMLVSLEPIAEGVTNTNYLLTTTPSLTLPPQGGGNKDGDKL